MLLPVPVALNLNLIRIHVSPGELSGLDSSQSIRDFAWLRSGWVLNRGQITVLGIPAALLEREQALMAIFWLPGDWDFCFIHRVPPGMSKIWYREVLKFQPVSSRLHPVFGNHRARRVLPKDVGWFRRHNFGLDD